MSKIQKITNVKQQVESLKSRTNLKKYPRFVGVYEDLDHGTYIARAGVRMLGEFNTADEAAEAYNKELGGSFNFPIGKKQEE